MLFMQKAVGLARPVINGLEFAAPVSQLLLRLWVAEVFWKSGLTKFQTMDATVFLFTYEYQVPLLPPVVAAYLATAVELVFPALLALGFGGRLAAGVLFVFNIMAVISYPALQVPGKLQHLMWGIMLLVPLLQGPGKISIDHFIRRRLMG